MPGIGSIVMYSWCNQGRTKGNVEENAPGNESLGGAEKSQQSPKYFLQYSIFAPERP